MIQAAECMSCKQEALSSNPSITKKKRRRNERSREREGARAGRRGWRRRGRKEAQKSIMSFTLQYKI
jgi:hypothetical protein